MHCERKRIYSDGVFFCIYFIEMELIHNHTHIANIIHIECDFVYLYKYLLSVYANYANALLFLQMFVKIHNKSLTIKYRFS